MTEALSPVTEGCARIMEGCAPITEACTRHTRACAPVTQACAGSARPNGSSQANEMWAWQHPAAGLAGKFDETEVLVERSRLRRSGVHHDRAYRERSTGGSDTLDVL